MRSVIALLGWIALAAPCGCGDGEAPPATSETPPRAQTAPAEPRGRRFPLESLATMEVRVGKASFRAWLADTPEKHEEGLMWVPPEQLGDRAMLFVFPTAEERSFWMKNTPTALDIAFFSADRILLNVGQGKPHSLDPVASEGPAQFVLEVRRGTFQRLGIRPGAKLEF
ncbi:MAG: DUF192 domain-containing protein [Fimbriimonadales bacterium]|nr:DUF192 domain-containing protein [Fimbriimonadales bacterium]